MFKRTAVAALAIGSLFAVAAPTVANAAPAAHAPVASVKSDAPVPTGCDPIRVAIGQMAKELHWTAEEIFKFLGIQPIVSIIDKPLVHPILWTPIAQFTCVDVDSHPADIG